jgi:hypothetical protein
LSGIQAKLSVLEVWQVALFSSSAVSFAVRVLIEECLS